MKKVGLIVLIVAGLAFSFYDYKRWRYEETKNYGHGPGEKFAPALELTQRYQNQFLGLRLRVPADWKITENGEINQKLASLAGREMRQVGIKEVFRPGEKGEVVRMENSTGLPKITIEMGYANASVTDLVGVETAELEEKGLGLLNDREYLASDSENWVLISWEEGNLSRKTAVAVRGERMVYVGMDLPIGEHDRYLKTVEEIIRSIRIT